MDAAEEEREIRLQRVSADLLVDFEQSLKPFLWRTLANGELRIRRRVQDRETDRLAALLEPFQELPQLLDPHLGRFLPALVDAFLEFLKFVPTFQKSTTTSSRLIPLSTAICKLLYIFCKIRGEKVIIRFLNAEARNLELLLSAIENADVALDPNSSGWRWEERYIALLWLSHLLLVPFDLVTISSASTADVEKQDIASLSWPADLPALTLRVIPIAVSYLRSAGKERDSAKSLLVRISIRKDMQELGLLRALVQWALARLHRSALLIENSVYHYIGILSYLAGILASSIGTTDMNPYLSAIFRTVQNISDRDNNAFKSIHSSALARKTIIKILRNIAVLILQGKHLQSVETNEILETTISYLLEALSDNDTPVRLSASKALSVITLKLAPDMAAQVVDAVLDSLNNNVLWVDKIAGQHHEKIRVLSAVNPLEWHGLILTLSHLLYRRSPPTDSLSDILHALLIGLSFERRSTSGSSIGTNVRDAACFGIWALARRYTTSELQKVKASSVFTTKQHDPSSSVLQLLATELLVAASLDSAGNIRRGASAALQELIGRHPDTIAKGIAVVQVVDYHAVALRSRAVLEVAPKAALLSKYYENALIDALLGWRGVGDGDAASRRAAATGLGLLAKGFSVNSKNTPWNVTLDLIERISLQLDSLKARELDQRHGLLLSMATVMNTMSDYFNGENIALALAGSHEMPNSIERIFRIVLPILEDAKQTNYRRPELIAEGVSRLLQATYPMLRADLVLRAISASPREDLFDPAKVDLSRLTRSSVSNDTITDAIAFSNDLQIIRSQGYLPNPQIAKFAEDFLNIWLRRREKEVITTSTEAATDLLLIIDSLSRHRLIAQWILRVSGNTKERLGEATGFLFALSAAFPFAETEQQHRLCVVILDQWRRLSHIGSKVTILQCLTQSTLLDSHVSEFIQLIAEGLDDYTTDGRGDIGSLVRVEALRAARKVFGLIPWAKIEKNNKLLNDWFMKRDTFSLVYGKVLRLAAEKLDRVRIEAQQVLVQICRSESEGQRFAHSSISSYDYFFWLLNLQTCDWLDLPLFEYQPSHWCPELFEGLVSSADTGSEDLIRVSRAALTDFCDGTGNGPVAYGGMLSQEDTSNLVCSTLFDVAKRNIANDRILTPTLEVIGFLFDVGVMQRSNIMFRSLYLLVQKAHYKTTNVRKLEASIKVYGSLLEVYPEAIQKLTGMLLHPFPKVRDHVADVLFVKKGVGKGIDWTKAGKDDLNRLLKELKEK